jgi:hypothetical protein
MDYQFTADKLTRFARGLAMYAEGEAALQLIDRAAKDEEVRLVVKLIHGEEVREEPVYGYEVEDPWGGFAVHFTQRNGLLLALE